MKKLRKNENIQHLPSFDGDVFAAQGLFSMPISTAHRGGRPHQRLHYLLKKEKKKKYVDTVFIGDGSRAVEITGSQPVVLKAA